MEEKSLKFVWSCKNQVFTNNIFCSFIFYTQVGGFSSDLVQVGNDKSCVIFLYHITCWFYILLLYIISDEETRVESNVTGVASNKSMYDVPDGSSELGATCGNETDEDKLKDSAVGAKR